MESQFFLHCTCPICYLPYDTQERIPRFITCTQGHTICSKCITIQIGMQDPFQCPFDKQLIIMLDNVISRFPINRALASIIEEGHSNCEVHIDKKLDLVCRPCRQQICDRCERKGPHTGHEVSVIEEALDEAKQKMDSIKQLVQKVHQSMDASQAEINLREQALLNEIDVKFSECIALLLKKREETQLLVREHCQRIKDLVEMEALATEDSNLVKIMNWSNVIEKQTTFMNGLAVQPVFYDLLEEDIESLNQNVDALITKEQERIQNIVKDIEKILVNFNPHLEHTFESLCEVINISREERSEEKDSFTWKADWNKLDLLTGFRTAEEMQFTSFVDKIIETYKFRLEAVQHLSQSGSPTSPKMPPFYLCSFSCFLGSDPKCSKLLKWYILDSTLQNSEKKVKLNELKLSENLFQILVEKINKLPEQIKIEGLLLKKEEKELLKEKIKEYGHKSLLITHLNFLLASYMKDRWIDACYAADQIIKIGEKDSYIEKVMKDATRINCLRLALAIEKAIEAQETEEAVQLINYLQGLVKSILDGNELHASQAQAIISEAVERLPEEASQQKQLKERLSQFNSAGYSQRELSKALQDYIPTTKKVQVQVEGECQEEQEEVHYWEEKGENSAYKMKQLTNEMLKALEPYVDFHNHLNTVQQIVTYEERKNLGYLYKESVEMSDI